MTKVYYSMMEMPSLIDQKCSMQVIHNFSHEILCDLDCTPLSIFFSKNSRKSFFCRITQLFADFDLQLNVSVRTLSHLILGVSLFASQYLGGSMFYHVHVLPQNGFSLTLYGRA